MFLLKHKFTYRSQRAGQSMIELAVVITILLLLLTTMVEFGVLLNQYVSVQDAARTTAREAAVTDPIADADAFYEGIPGQSLGVFDLSEKVLEPIKLNTAIDNVIVSVYSVEKNKTPKLIVSRKHYDNSKVTKFTGASLAPKLDSGAPNTGFVVVEIYYGYPQMLKLPFVTQIVPDPIPLYVFAIMPLSAAEPTSTPKP